MATKEELEEQLELLSELERAQDRQSKLHVFFYGGIQAILAGTALLMAALYLDPHPGWLLWVLCTSAIVYGLLAIGTYAILEYRTRLEIQTKINAKALELKAKINPPRSTK